MIQVTKLVRYLKSQRSHFKGVEIADEANVEIKVGVDQVGPGTIIGPRAWISSKNGGTLRIGKRCEVGLGTLILTYGGDITIGDDCSFNPYCVIYGHGGLTIGNFVRIATHTVIIPANHRYDRRDVPIHQQGLTMKGVTIEDNVWVGAGVVILDGVRIGTGSVVAAGAVVSQDVESYSVFAGVPARRIK